MQLIAGGGRVRASTSTCSTPTKIIPEELVPVRPVGKHDARTATRTTSSPRPSRSRSTSATSCRASTSPTIRCCRGGSSPTSTRSSSGSAARTSRRSRSTARSRRCTTTSATASCARRDQPRRGPTTSRTRSAAAARCRCAGAGGLRPLPGARRRPQDPRAQRQLRRPLQPGHAVLEQHVRLGEGAHRRGVPVRAGQGRAPSRT